MIFYPVNTGGGGVREVSSASGEYFDIKQKEKRKLPMGSVRVISGMRLSSRENQPG